MEQNDNNQVGVIGLQLNAVSAPRVDRLGKRHSETSAWPVFQRLFMMQQAQPNSLELTSEEIDSLIAVYQFVHSEPELPVEAFDAVLDSLVYKIENKGGARCDLGQIQDIVYEAEVALLLSRFMPGFFKLEPEDHNRPDQVFKVHFFMNDQPAEVAIECKNIRQERRELRDLVRTVTKAVIGAVKQHETRRGQFNDLIIFVDLPLSVISFPPKEYSALIVNVWHQLRLEGVSCIDETQVIFTATSQQGMADYLKRGPNQPRGLNLLPPIVVDGTSLEPPAPRLFFLSCLFRSTDDNANVNNWSKVAIHIANPEQYLS